MVSLLQRVTFESAKVTQTLLPHHSAPRLGSVCPHSGIAPRVAAMGHPWPSAAKPASLPVSPLRNACVRPAWLTGRPGSKSKPRRPSGRPGFQAGALRLFGRAHTLHLRCSPVGASLLAKASCQSTSMLNVSRIASRLAPAVGNLLGMALVFSANDLIELTAA